MFCGTTISILRFLLAKLWYDNLMLRMENENLKRDLETSKKERISLDKSHKFL